MQGNGHGAGGLIPGAAGFQAMQAFLGQQGQIPGVPGQAILTQRLAVLPPGARGGLAAGQGYRAAAPQMPLGVMMKPPNRKTNAAVKGRKSCNCKNSKCLKLYCECFASGRYCDNCNCISCYNNKDSEAVRQAAVESILERNPNAFRPKIQTAEGDTHPQSIRNAPDGSVRHTKGCNCKKSSCLKKYCECFQGGIFCTEICKCVDCKNFDGSEARAQVMTHHGDPYSVQAAVAAAAAQQQALGKRPRMGLQQQPLMQPQGLQASLLQQQQQHALQQLAAVSMGPAAAAAAAVQYQALAGLGLPAPALPAMSAALPIAGLSTALPAGAAGAEAGLTPAGSTAAAALPQLPARPPILDAVHDLVKPEVVDDLCSLLVIVAQEQADRTRQPSEADGQQQPDLQQSGQEQEQEQGPATAPGGLTIKTEPPQPGAAGEYAGTEAAEASSRCNGLKRRRDEGGDTARPDGEDGFAAKRAATGDGIAGGAVADAEGTRVAQQQNGIVGQGEGGLSELYVAQEGVVLQEFNQLIQRIISKADKTASAAAETAAAAEAAAAADASAAAAADAAAADQAAAAAAAAAALYDGVSLGDVGDPHQQQLLQQVAEQLQQQQHDQLQLAGQHDIKQLARSQALPQQQALAAQQALLMQAAAANNNLALLQQASRGLYLQNAAQQQQQQQLMQPLMMQAAAAAGGMGMQLQGLNALRPNALQMIQVMAQDGTLHHVPAHTLLSLQLAAAGGLPQQGGQQQQLGALPQAAGAAPQQADGAADGAPVADAAAAAAAVGSAPAAQPISLLSLLNGTGPASGNSP